jgi:hypothetical protein
LQPNLINGVLLGCWVRRGQRESDQ